MPKRPFISISFFSVIILLSVGLCFSACQRTPTYPKPRGYFKIQLPIKHQYQNFDSTGFPFRFRYPTYATITQDSNLVREENAPYWIDVSFQDLGAKIYLSYKTLSPKEPLEKLVNESYVLSYSHDIMADYIKSPQIRNKQGLIGVFYEVGGNAASAYQFFLTDQTHHFMHGSLYFDVAPNADSLQPALQFLRQDLDTLIESFSFTAN